MGRVDGPEIGADGLALNGELYLPVLNCRAQRSVELMGFTPTTGWRPTPSVKENDLDVFFAEDLYNDPSLFDRAVDALHECVYVTFDLDGLDPSIMPATGTPEPGGLQWYETVAFLKKVAQKRTIIGCDIVELAPSDSEHSSPFLAAKLAYKILNYAQM